MDKQIKKDYISKYDDKMKNMSFNTKTIHCGQEPDLLNGGMAVPINLSTTFAQHSPCDPYGDFDYTRCGNPTRKNLERLYASLHGGNHALAFSSGCAATVACTNLIKSGEHVVCINDVYGGTQRFFRRISNPMHQIEYSFINMESMDVVKSSLTEKTRMVWVESPTNPTLKVTDIRALCKTVKAYNKDIIIVCDNTFLSPYNCKPLELGVDIVVESATKYLGGHSDVLMGLLSTSNKDLHDKLFFISKTTGGVPSPFDCFMAIRGIKTLHLRMERHNFNALEVAKFLEKHELIEKVYYNGLESNPYNKLALSQQKGCGGVVSALIKGDLVKTKSFLAKLSVFTLAESLGAVESLAEHPAMMTHNSVPKELRDELGIGDSFVRLSVGCEAIEDIIADLDNALKTM